MAEQPAPAAPAAPTEGGEPGTTRIVKVDPATKEEVEAFIAANSRWIEDAGAVELRNMSPEDQRRVISGGTLVSCRDSAGVMRSRVRQAKEKEAILSGAHLASEAASSTTLSRPATKDEVEAFIASNRRWMTPESEEIMKLMNPLDQKRVISGGTLSGCRDSVAVLQTRAKRGREMELEFEQIAAGKKVEPPKPAAEQMPMPLFSAEAARAFIHATPQEVRVEHSRFASAAEPGDSFVTEETSGPLTGEVKGIGGVIEMLRAKYGCSKGQRLRVIGETPALLQFEGGRTAPKNHEGTGWKWVISSGQEKKPSKDEASRQAEIAAAFKAREERLAEETAQKAKDKERRAAEKAAKEEGKSEKEEPVVETAETAKDKVPVEPEKVEAPDVKMGEDKEKEVDAKEKEDKEKADKEKEELSNEKDNEAEEEKRNSEKKAKEEEKEKLKDKEKEKKDKSHKEPEKEKGKEKEKEKAKDKEKEKGKEKEKEKKEKEKEKEKNEKKEKKEKDNKESEKEKEKERKEKSTEKDRDKGGKEKSKGKDKERSRSRDEKDRSRRKSRSKGKEKVEVKRKDKEKEKRKRSDSSRSSRAKKKEKEKEKRKRSDSSASRAKKKEKEKAKEREKHKRRKSSVSASRSKKEKKTKRRRSSS